MNVSIFALTASLVSLLIAVGAAFVAFHAARAAESRLQLPRSLDSRVQSLEQRVEDSQLTLEQVANRVKMMRVRNAANHVPDKSGEPDPYRDPSAWRQAMNRRLAQGKL